MRHKKKFNHLGRKRAHRKAMLSNMATSLILHKRIKTTLAKAKALRVFVEPIITRSKDDTTHQRRMTFRKLQSKDAVQELFRDIAVKIGDRPGGYTRIIKLPPRLGDNADMSIIELVDYNELMVKETKKKTKTRRRSRKRGGDKATATTATAAITSTDTATEVEEKVEDVKEVVEEKTTSKVVEVKEKTEDVKEVVEEKVEEVKEKAKDVKAQVEEKVEEVKDELKNKDDKEDKKD